MAVAKSTVVDVGDQSVIFGLDWVPLVGDLAEQREVRELALARNSARAVRVFSDRTILYGFLDGDTASELGKTVTRKKVISASALFASMPNVTPNAIWLDVQDEVARLAVLKGGSPVGWGDYVGSMSEAESRIEQIRKDSTAYFQFYGSHSNTYRDCIPLTLEDMVREANAATATLQKISKGVGVKQVLLLVALCVVTGYVALPYIRAMTKPKITRQVVDPNEIYERAIDSKLAAAGTVVRTAAPAMTAGWDTEILQAGWRLTKVTCNVEKCAFLWTEDGGNFKSLVAALGSNSVELSLDGKTATYSTGTGISDSQGVKRGDLGTTQSFLLDVGSLGQDVSLFKVQLHIGKATPFGIEQAGSVSVPIIKPILVGALEGRGPASLLRETLARLPNSVTLDEVVIETRGIDPQFEFRGKYYVKS